MNYSILKNNSKKGFIILNRLYIVLRCFKFYINLF